MIKKCVKTIKVRNEELIVHMRNYTNNGNIALTLDCIDGEPYGVATTNLRDLPEDECYIKAGQENSGILEALLSEGIISLTGNRCISGFCTYEIAKVNLDLFEEE